MKRCYRCAYVYPEDQMLKTVLRTVDAEGAVTKHPANYRCLDRVACERRIARRARDVEAVGK